MRLGVAAALVEGTLVEGDVLVDSGRVRGVGLGGVRGLALLAGATVGGNPEEPGLAPVAAIRRIWQGETLAMAEIMEAYAVQAIAVVEGAGLDPAIVNVAGGGLARGHPIGASGAILAVRLFHGLGRGRGLAAIAAAGGIGTALLVEAPT